MRSNAVIIHVRCDRGSAGARSTSIDAALAQETEVPGHPAVARFMPQLRVGAGRVTVGVVGRL